MDQNTSRIKAQIESERAKLDANLSEVEARIRAATDLESHFRRRPWVWTGAAVGLGVVIAYAQRSRSSEARTVQDPVPGVRRRSVHLQEAETTMDDIVGAFVGLATRTLTDLIAEAVPGFDAELDRARRRSERDREGTGRGPVAATM